MDTMPTTCTLQHRGFAVLGAIIFRSDSDGTPVLAMPIGGQDAVVPLRSLQRELDIRDDSPDGRMLGLIAASLDFVSGLRPGEPLPAEVISGEASWEPRAEHRARAERNLQMQLIAWLGRGSNPGSGQDVGRGASGLGRLSEDAGLRASIQNALAEAAEAIGVPNAEAVLPLIATVVDELAYIEELRETLLGSVRRMAGCVAALGGGWRGDSTRLDALKQVQRLSAVALEQIVRRFTDIDGETSQIITTLRSVDTVRTFIRTNRDWLHRSRRAWEPILNAWRMPPHRLDDAAWVLMQRTYQFLAPRFMPFQEWQSAKTRRGDGAMDGKAVLRW